MKRKLLIGYNAILALLLTIIGVGGACSMSGCEYGTPGMEYGTPSAKFKVTGTVKSEANTAISNIRVVMQYDTAYTDINGVYHTEMEGFPEDQTFAMKFDDVDGSQNGSFQSVDTSVTFTDPEFIHGDGSWYEGETTEELNIKLKPEN
jgi:putative lipoprotein (rSAM/lipoprotein system)